MKILKTYIKINLVSNFIKFFKSLAYDFIFFNKKLNRIFQFFVNYQRLIFFIYKN